MCIIFLFISACTRHVFFVITKCCFFPPSFRPRMKCSWRGMNEKKKRSEKITVKTYTPGTWLLLHRYTYILYYIYPLQSIYIYVRVRPSSTRNNWLVSFATKDRYTYVRVYLPPLHPPPCADITWPE